MSSTPRFEINFLCEEDDRIAFHFNPRFTESDIVCNSFMANHWGQEETCCNFPFGAEEPFQVTQHVTYLLTISGQCCGLHTGSYMTILSLYEADLWQTFPINIILLDDSSSVFNSVWMCASLLESNIEAICGLNSLASLSSNSQNRVEYLAKCLQYTLLYLADRDLLRQRELPRQHWRDEDHAVQAPRGRPEDHHEGPGGQRR